MVENEPQSHQFKHPTRIILDGYRGIARDIMEINDAVADGFMTTADIRGNIAIIQKPQDRALDYDQVGFVRVGRFLQLPRLGVWHQDNLVQTRKEDDTYYVAINDQELANNVARSNDGKHKFDDLYVDTFKEEVNKGIKSVLKREKLLNGGDYDYGFFVSYYEFLSKDLLLLPLIEISSLVNGTSPLLDTMKVGLGYLSVNGLFNAFNLFTTYYKKFSQDVFKNINPRLPSSRLPSYNEPFIRHTIPDMAMPTVPVDRLLKGTIYLARHGKEIIKSP